MKVTLFKFSCNGQATSEERQVVEVDENDDNSLANRVDEIGLQIAANSKHIVALGKKAFYQQIEIENLNKAYDLGIYFY